jgi:hypothetical protein
MKYILLFLISFRVLADGVLGLEYVAYTAGGATPTRTTNRTILSSGIVPSLNYNWGSGVVMDSGRTDGVLVHFTGNILWPGPSGNKTITFYNRSDDGFYMSINNTTVINNWIEQGPANFNGSGSITLTSGQVYTIDVWWYENGGGAVIQLNWDVGSGIVVVPTNNLATSPSYFVPPLCCGGSSFQFNTNTVNAANVQSFINRATSDTQVYIEQIGDLNTITITQSGSKNNFVNYYGVGSNNTVNIDETLSSISGTNYTELIILGNNNNASILQLSSGGDKGIFSKINGDNNSLLSQQKDNGNHYLEIELNGNNKNVDTLQQGSGNHMAKIIISGQPTDLSLSQSGNTNQSYSINFNCATLGGCAKISVQQ